MKKFNYEARDKATGKIVKSLVQADSETSAAKVLIEQGYMPLTIKEEGGDNNIFARFANRITNKDKIVFSRQLATLIGAGLPLTQIVQVFMQFDKIVFDIINSVVFVTLCLLLDHLNSRFSTGSKIRYK